MVLQTNRASGICIYLNVCVFIYIFSINIFIQIYFKELAHTIAGASKSEIRRAGQLARYSGRN